MLQANSANSTLDRVAYCWTVCTGFAFLAVMVVHRSGDVTSASDLILGREHAGCAKEEGRCWRCAEGEMKGAVRPDRDACRYWCPGVVMRCAGVELL
jgi:hypothetical protein